MKKTNRKTLAKRGGGSGTTGSSSKGNANSRTTLVPFAASKSRGKGAPKVKKTAVGAGKFKKGVKSKMAKVRYVSGKSRH